MPDKQQPPGKDKGKKEDQPPQQPGSKSTGWDAAQILARPDQIFPFTQPPHHDEPPPHQEEPPHHEESQHKEQPKATVEFLTGWRQQQHGEIRSGEKLVIRFDPSRLPQCRQSSHGAQVWDIDVGMIFHPGGQFFGGSVMAKERMPNGGMVIGLSPQTFEVTVPSDAASVEMWFHNYTTIGHGCEAWDSRYCQNYWFGVERY
jgi:hypothetical protein